MVNNDVGYHSNVIQGGYAQLNNASGYRSRVE